MKKLMATIILLSSFASFAAPLSNAQIYKLALDKAGLKYFSLEVHPTSDPLFMVGNALSGLSSFFGAEELEHVDEVVINFDAEGNINTVCVGIIVVPKDPGKLIVQVGACGDNSVFDDKDIFNGVLTINSRN